MLYTFPQEKQTLSFLSLAQWRGLDKEIGATIIFIHLDEDFQIDIFLQLDMATYTWNVCSCSQIFHDIWWQFRLVER